MIAASDEGAPYVTIALCALLSCLPSPPRLPIACSAPLPAAGLFHERAPPACLEDGSVWRDMCDKVGFEVGLGVAVCEVGWCACCIATCAVSGVPRCWAPRGECCCRRFRGTCPYIGGGMIAPACAGEGHRVSAKTWNNKQREQEGTW